MGLGQQILGVWIQWNGMVDWNGLEWNGGMERYFGNFNWWSPLYKDHLFIKTVLL